jgi:dienelactone hydrolase
MNVYGEAGHSFTNPGVGALGMPGFDYHAETDRRSWAAMLDLFDETLGPVRAS